MMAITVVKNILLGLLMCVASMLAFGLTPTQYLADTLPPMNLEASIPQRFAGWQQLQQQAQIVNPQRQQSLDKFYAQILTRTYINEQGEMVMLSIAYGKDQSDEKQVHYPEVCYPAQGFQVLSNQVGTLQTAQGQMRVKRLETKLRSRYEPITYWTTVGNKLALSGFEAKKAQLIYGFNGVIPDGLIFRVSSISRNTKEAFSLHASFIADLIPELTKANRLRLAPMDS